MERTRKLGRKLTYVNFETGECGFQDPTVLANDPSLTAWGWSIVMPDGEVKQTGCIKTTPEHKKKRIRKGDDTTRRISEINHILISIIKKWNVGLIISELPHGSQNAPAAVLIGVVTGVAHTLSDTLNIPIEWYSEQDAKKACVGKKAVTKEDMIKAISLLYKMPWTEIKYIDEAVADSMAIFHVANQQSELLKMMKR